MTDAESPEPPIDAVIGHLFDGEAHMVFAEPDGRQFILAKPTLERLYSNYLDPGQTWRRIDYPSPLVDRANMDDQAIAYHEAGHAVACMDEGIRVEFITIIPFTGWKGEDRRGCCCYDYRLRDALRNDFSDLAEKTAKADLGGPCAECVFRQRNKLDTPWNVQFAWSYDRRNAGEHLARKARRLGKTIDLDSELDRLSDELKSRFQEPWAWDAITQIANKLCEEGAISGQAAKEILEQAKQAATPTHR